MSHDDLLGRRLVDAIYYRQERGEETTLRTLHRILDVVQPVALRLAYRLQTEGVIEIESDADDAFAARITITESVACEIARKRDQPRTKRS